ERRRRRQGRDGAALAAHRRRQLDLAAASEVGRDPAEARRRLRGRGDEGASQARGDRLGPGRRARLGRQRRRRRRRRARQHRRQVLAQGEGVPVPAERVEREGGQRERLVALLFARRGELGGAPRGGGG